MTMIEMCFAGYVGTRVHLSSIIQDITHAYFQTRKEGIGVPLSRLICRRVEKEPLDSADFPHMSFETQWNASRLWILCEHDVHVKMEYTVHAAGSTSVDVHMSDITLSKKTLENFKVEGKETEDHKVSSTTIPSIFFDKTRESKFSIAVTAKAVLSLVNLTDLAKLKAAGLATVPFVDNYAKT
ncbi:hypothetical protein B0O80DRAFT_501175 [Mortierella sp. GBAus27b]|nr:hypothetical protein B0O80DRAFT_501175 [Mortierella sp. GBAus27b]